MFYLGLHKSRHVLDSVIDDYVSKTAVLRSMSHFVCYGLMGMYVRRYDLYVRRELISHSY